MATYQRIVPLMARRLTEQDAEDMGYVDTQSGRKQFQVGDYLARDLGGTYVIDAGSFGSTYYAIGEPDDIGFTQYMSSVPVRAMAMQQAFNASGVEGEAGDYQIGAGWGAFVNDRASFETMYTLVGED